MFEPGAPADAARIEDYIRAIRERWLLVILAPLLLAVAASTFASSRAAVYTADARIGVGPSPVGAPNPNNLRAANLEREREEIESNAVAEAAATRIGAPGVDAADLLGALTVSFRPDSEVLRVEVRDGDPQFAADAANAIAETYVEARQGAATAWYQTRVDGAEASLAAVDAAIADLEERLASLDVEQAELQLLLDPTAEEASRLRRIQVEVGNLASELTAERTVRRSLALDAVDRSNEARVQTPAAVLLRSAVPPTSPDGVSNGLITLGGALLGLLLGISGAFLAQRLDNTARDESAVSRSLATGVIGSIPSLGLSRFRLGSTLAMLSVRSSARPSAARESYRLLAGAVEYIRKANGVKAIVISSAVPGEGKSTTAANLAVALAQSGVTTVLVSADLRRPTQAQFFGESETPGLTTFLAGEGELIPLPIGPTDNLFLVPSGPKPANPGELLGSAGFGEMIEQLRAAADVVLIDTPPLLVTADANLAAQHVDGLLVVVDAMRTGTDELSEVRATLERTGAPILGAVLNKTRWKWRLPGRSRYAYYGNR